MIPDTPEDVIPTVIDLPLIQPQAHGMITEQYIMNHTLFATPAGHIYTLPNAIVYDNDVKDSGPFDRFTEQIGWEGFDTFSEVLRKRWMLIHFTGDDTVAAIVFDNLLKCCDIVGIGSAGGHCTAMMRRKSYTKPQLTGVLLLKIYIPQLQGRRNSDDVMFDCLRAWSQAQDKIMTNFAVHLPMVSAESILLEWGARSLADVQLDIIDARSTSKAARTARQHFIFGQHAQLLALRKIKSESADMSVVKFSDLSLLPLQVFQPPPSMIMCWRRDAVSGSMETFSIKQFIYDGPSNSMEHLKYALVLYGAPRMAKTPFAKSISMALASLHQAGAQFEPFVMILNTAEAMPRNGDSRVKTGVPIIFDDMRPGAIRLGRPPHSIEDMKVLGDIPAGGDMAARYSDIHFEPNQPRIFTSNDLTPNEFHSGFPYELENMTADTVMSLDNHTKALLKRFAFCHVQTCLIPQVARDAYEAARVAANVVVAADLFAGANAIP